MYKYVMTFISGAVIGAAAVLLWLRKDYNKKIEEAVTEHEQKAAEAKKEAEKAKKELESEKKNADVRLQNELCRRLGYTGDAAEVMTRKTDTRDFKSNVGEFAEPYGISGDDFLYDNHEYSKVTLKYYRSDGILSTEDGIPVEDVHRVLGDNWQDEIGLYDDDVAYIRNERAGSDYEVICEDMEYAQEYGVEAPD